MVAAFRASITAASLLDDMRLADLSILAAVMRLVLIVSVLTAFAPAG